MSDMVRQRVFCTIREDLVKFIDQEVEKTRFRNRSHAIEYALVKLKESLKEE